MAKLDLSGVLDKFRTESAILKLMEYADRAMRGINGGDWNVFHDYIDRYGVEESNGTRYIGTPNKLSPHYTDKFFSGPLSREEKFSMQLFITPLTPANQAEYLYDNALKIVAEDRDFFSPASILGSEEAELVRIIKEKLGSRHPESVVRSWKRHAQVFLEKYDGNPGKMFERGMHPNEAFERIMEFDEYGRKNAALFLGDQLVSGIYDPGENRRFIPIPPDIHVMRFVIKSSTEKPKETAAKLHLTHGDKLADATQRYLMEITAERPSLNPVLVDDVVWTWTREKCARAPNPDCGNCPGNPYHSDLSVFNELHPEGHKREGLRTGKVAVVYRRKRKELSRLHDFHVSE